MSVKAEIMALEEKLRIAELGPDPKFFEEHLHDDVMLDGQKLKSKVVEAHRPQSQHKFDKVTMSDFEIIEYDNAAVVKCTGHYEGAKWSGSMKFMRVWLKTENGWKIIAGSTLQ